MEDFSIFTATFVVNNENIFCIFAVFEMKAGYSANHLQGRSTLQQ